jgi:hypothetical protein
LRKPESGTETGMTARFIMGLATRDAVEGTGNLRKSDPTDKSGGQETAKTLAGIGFIEELTSVNHTEGTGG